jgi:hypothetical protein
MAERNRATGRHFLTFSTIRGFKAPVREPEHRRDFVLSISPSVDEVLTELLSGKVVGDMLVDAVGETAELCGLSTIISDPGASKQAVHADAEWSADAPRLITIFIALHDIDSEDMGPTVFVPKTHKPDCFADKKWLPPTERLVAERGGTTWFEMSAGDCIVMDSRTWHAGGANTSSDKKRALLSFSFIACPDGGADGKLLRLRDFRK